MKFRYFLVSFIFLLALSLAGCTCSHEWTEADCLNPQICAKCAEMGAPATGHDWASATCTLPETCTRCGTTQGDPVPHIYGEWIFEDDDMHRTCAVCSNTENTVIDRELYLESLLPGYWDFFGMYSETGYVPAAQLAIGAIGFHFDADKTTTFHVSETGTQQLIWSFDSYEQEDSSDSYYFTLSSEAKTYSMCLRHNLGDLANRPEKELILLSNPLLMFSQFHSLNHELVGNWGITTDRWGNILGNPGNWLTFQDDRTITGNLNGAIDGVWYVVANYYTSFQTPDDYSILIKTSDGTEHVLTFTPGEKPGLDVMIGRARHSFSHINENALEQIKISNSIHLGTWISTEVRYQGNIEKTTSEYSVTFNEDGTFTANLGKELSGLWMVRSITDAYDKDWTNGNDSPTYQYYMYVDGLKREVYCQVDARSDRKQFIIHNFELMDDREINFQQYSDEEFTLITQRDTYPIGKWSARSFYVDNTADGTRTEDVNPENNFFEFHEDGTFTAVLQREYTGTWKFEKLDFTETSIGNYWEMDYLLTFDGQSDQVRIHIELLNEPEFYIHIPHFQKEGYKIVAGFQKG